MAGGGEGPTFELTPSWIIGLVVFVIVAISLAIEKLLHRLGKWLLAKEKIPLYVALQKIKEELMLLGFISLLLTFFQDEIQNWCISEKLVKKWLPCHYVKNKDSATTAHFLSNGGRRLLAAGGGDVSCPTGKVPFVSLKVLHDLHYLIFVLAIVHVVSCVIIVLLGEFKIRLWRKWERAIELKNGYADANAERDRIIDIKNLSFIKQRYEGFNANKRNYVISFFKHLAGIVTKADYEAMRMGFVLTHCNGNQRFNFYKYIVYAYEADFNKMVSISWFLWLLVVLLLTLNVVGSHIFFVISIVPLALLLIVGTKLEQVITDIAISIAQRHTVIIGQVNFEPSDEYFWWKKPKIILTLLHIILFINSFGTAIYFWTLFMFGKHSCVMDSPGYLYSKIAITVVSQIICSYSTLPLYAIVTQMGSSYNKEAMKRYSTTEPSHTTVADTTPEERVISLVSH